MILYHGTTLDAWENIQKLGIDVLINAKRELDFGYGFYLGEKEYAIKVAIDKASIGNKEDKSNIPVLIKFNINISDIVNTLSSIDANKVLVYPKRNLEFAKCVFENRYNKGKDVLSVDFVIAPLADGKVDDVMSYYKEKETLLRKAVCLYNYLKPQYSKMKQYVFKKQGLCSAKDIISVENLQEGGLLYEQKNENL